MDGVAQLHVAVQPQLWLEAVKAGLADPAKFHHSRYAEATLGRDFILDLIAAYPMHLVRS